MGNTKTEQRAQGRTGFYGITVGTVVDVNDPQQMGRIRVLCPALGDKESTPVTDLLWASYMAPFGGITTCGTRGPEQENSNGPVSYGMWAIPKVGSYAFVMCIDGNTEYRVWLGCLYGPFMPHTMPSGRWTGVNTNGPLTSTEKPIEPLYSNMREAFGDFEATFEGRSRAADNQVSAVDNEILDRVVSGKPDEKNDTVGYNARKGYQKSRQRPDLEFESTGGNYDSQMYTITTPGLHSITMDDSLANGRIRFRTTSGNQIILDDTNERIYISTSNGKNWIEMDKVGNIDIYSDRRISIHSAKDINLTANESIRMTANDIHMKAASSIRLGSDDKLGIFSTNLTLEGLTKTDISSPTEVNIATTGSGGKINLNADVAGGVISLLAEPTVSGELRFDASLLQYNNGAAIGTTAAAPISTDSLHVFTTNRVPLHEPWGRTMIAKSSTGDDNSGVGISPASPILSVTTSSGILDLSYKDPDVGKKEYGEDLGRSNNLYWRR